MSEHNYSNQKTALEDYFESLFNDDEVAAAKVEPETTESKSAAAEAVEITDVKEDEKAVVTEEPVTKNIEPQIHNDRNSARSSVADMLASVETIAASEPTEIKDFAEPVVEMPLPMPKVAEQIETKVEVVEEVKVGIAEPETVEVTAVEERLEVAEVQEVITAPSVIPEWAEERFQCLMFMVGGLSLAVPLVKLNGVISWTDKIVETPNKTDWYLGVLMNHGNKVEIIDTAVMVLPEQHRQEMAAEPADRLSHILLVDDQRWGLACDSIGEVVWLKQDDVKWRSNKTKRPWLLGTAIKQMCAVLDTEAFANMLGQK